MVNVITVVGEQKSAGVDEYYVVGDNGWTRLGVTNRKRDLIQSSVNRFEKQIRSGSVLVVAHLGTEKAAMVTFDQGEFKTESMDFDDVDW